MFRRGVGGHERHGGPSGDGTHIDDASSPGADQWEERLRDRDEAEHVDFELPPPVGEGQEFDRPRDADSGIVHQTGEAAFSNHGCHGMTGCRDRGRIGDIEANRHESRSGLLLEPFSVSGMTNACEDTVPQLVERQRTRGPDAGRGAGDDDGVGLRRL